MAKSRRELYWERKTADPPLCTRCGALAAEDSSLCVEHRDDNRRLASKSLQKLRAERRERGECADCGDLSPVNYRCPGCTVIEANLRGVNNSVNNRHTRIRDVADRAWKEVGGKFRLPVLRVKPPPATRAECADIPRPCDRYTCVHHTWTNAERDGKPHRGMPPPPAVERGLRTASCALDVAVDAHEEGCGRHRGLECGCDPDQLYGRIGEVLGVTMERASQIGRRALAKVRVGNIVLDHIEELRSMLPAGATLETLFPRSLDPNGVYVTIVVTVDEAQKQRGDF